MTDLQKRLLKEIYDKGDYAPVGRNEKNAMTRLLNSGRVRFVSTGRYGLTEFGAAAKDWEVKS